MKIYISPSSQTENVGVGNYGTEAQRMQELANKLGTALANKSHTIFGCKNTLNLDQRIAESNNLKAEYHIALHSNAGGGSGPEVFYHTDSPSGLPAIKTSIAKTLAIHNLIFFFILFPSFFYIFYIILTNFIRQINFIQISTERCI